MRAHSFPLFLTAALALAACNPYEFNKPVGSEIDEGGFGNATMNNTLLMTGQIDATSALGITFAFNSSQLTEAARVTLRQQADWIRQFPEVRFRVYGHTDLVGSDAYNKSLGLRRAQAVVAYFGSLGISTTRLEAVVSYGKTQPVIQTPGPEERNRRTVTEVSGFVNDSEMLLNGKYAAIIMREYINNAVRPHPPNTDISTQVNPAAGQ
jgi:outer membrane protein OmpA-like peptidoglycan-associated protein